MNLSAFLEDDVYIVKQLSTIELKPEKITETNSALFLEETNIGLAMYGMLCSLMYQGLLCMGDRRYFADDWKMFSGGPYAFQFHNSSMYVFISNIYIDIFYHILSDVLKRALYIFFFTFDNDLDIYISLNAKVWNCLFQHNEIRLDMKLVI